MTGDEREERREEREEREEEGSSGTRRIIVADSPGARCSSSDAAVLPRVFGYFRESRSFQGWTRQASIAKSQRVISTTIVKRWRAMSLAVPFSAWAFDASQQRRLREVADKVVRRWNQRSLAAPFASWRDACSGRAAASAVPAASELVLRWNKLRLNIEPGRVDEGNDLPSTLAESADIVEAGRDPAKPPDAYASVPAVDRLKRVLHQDPALAASLLDASRDGSGAGGRGRTGAGRGGGGVDGGGDDDTRSSRIELSTFKGLASALNTFQGSIVSSRSCSSSPKDKSTRSPVDPALELGRVACAHGPGGEELRLPTLPASMLASDSWREKLSIAPLWTAGNTPRNQSPSPDKAYKLKTYAVDAESVESGPTHISRIVLSSFKGLVHTGSPGSSASLASEEDEAVSNLPLPAAQIEPGATRITISSFRSMGEARSRMSSSSPTRVETPRRSLSEYYVKVEKGLVYLKTDPLTVRVLGDKLDEDRGGMLAASGSGTGGHLRARLRPFLLPTRKPCTYPGGEGCLCRRLCLASEDVACFALFRPVTHFPCADNRLQATALSRARWPTSK